MGPVSFRFRLLVTLLVAGLGGGQALLDGCVVSCHPAAAKNARTAHCHDGAASTSGSHLQAVARCCHDGPGGLADTGDGRLSLSVSPCQAVPASAQNLERPGAGERLAPAFFFTLPTSQSLHPPLRV